MLIGFDLEIADHITNPSDWRRPDLGITCAATVEFDLSQAKPLVWAAGVRGLINLNHKQQPATLSFSDRMTRGEANDLLDYLWDMTVKGHKIVSFNGVAFDFRILGHEARNMSLAARVAIESIDIMMVFASIRRHMVSLASLGAAFGYQKGYGLVSDGKAAPIMWAAGKRRDVLWYVANDATITLKLFRDIMTSGGFMWVRKSGGIATEPLPDHLRTVNNWITRNVIARRWVDPEPWIRDPAMPQDFVYWIPEAAFNDYISP